MIYRLSSVQINLPKTLANKIIEWGHEHVPDQDVYEHPGYGREDDIHLTVFHGIKGEGFSTIKSILRDFKSFTVELGQVSVFANPDYHVLKIEALSNQLHKMHEEIQDKVKYVSTFPDYKPHVTIAYLKKGKAWKHEGKSEFDGELFEVDAVLFSDRDGNKSKITLRK